MQLFASATFIICQNLDMPAVSSRQEEVWHTKDREEVGHDEG